MKNNVVDVVDTLIYGFDNKHIFIGDNNNIGSNGENLTIIILSYNRSDATIKLIESIENIIDDFQGTILVVDNCSREEEYEKVFKRMEKLKIKNKLIKFDRNYGVAGGRNRAVEYVTTDWIMFLDNDMYFIANPIKNIKSAIAKLGCRFLNLPILNETGKKVFANGGHIYFDIAGSSIYVGAGSLFKQNPIEKSKEYLSLSISTFLYGGSSVLHKNTFIESGMFDDNMFIGFEDIDFSIRLFQKGYKIGNCDIFALIHDHSLSEDFDIEYEKERFSSDILYNSAIYFEKKHGLKVWNKSVEKWLIEKHESMNSDIVFKNEDKPLIALIVDTKDWAFANIAKQIMDKLSDKYRFKYIVMDDIQNIVKILMIVQECDIVHFFWRGHLSWLDDKEVVNNYLKSLGYQNPEIVLNEFINSIHISTAVYDHLYLNEDIDMTHNIFKYVDSYYVSSEKLKNIYCKLDTIKPISVITDGVSLEKFYPINLKRFDNIEKRKIVVGWVGNSKWSGVDKDFKGVNTILKPVIEELIKEGYPIEMYFADKQERMIPHHLMVDYYSKIDIYVCVSENEGTPNPVLESMACGVPIISTDVGIVPEAFGTKQKEFIMEERTKECLKSKLLLILENPKILKDLSQENLIQIKNWTWDIKTNDFDNYFQKCLGCEKND